MLTIVLLFISLVNVNSKLVQVHVAFRHGARFPVDSNSFPNDPYSSLTYKPYGFGALTRKGVHQAIRLGKELRYKYNDLLGEYYNGNQVKMVTTSVERAINTGLGVYAGMWPPKFEFFHDMHWQPTPLYPLSDDNLILRHPMCFTRIFAIHKVVTSSNFTDLMKPYQKEIDYITQNAGYTNPTYLDFFILHQQLEAYHFLGLSLPEWTKSVYPETTSILGGLNYVANTFTPELNRGSGGSLLKKIIDDSLGYIENNLNIKLAYFYSGHEYNIAFLLRSLKVFDLQVPPYTSYVSVELHEINNQYLFRVLYQNYSSIEPHVMKIPGCDYFCPKEQFIKILSENVQYGEFNC